ncbi:MAG: hypothetical protein ACYS8S_08100, partial [Planctomycetota bacterium]
IQLKGPLEQALDFAVSQSLWARLEKPGEYLLRLQSTSQLSNDMIFTTDSPGSQAWSIKIDSSIPDNAMGRFGLQASQEPPLNVFVPIEWLAEKAGVAGKANPASMGKTIQFSRNCPPL